MKFWDASVLIPLIIQETTSSFCEDLLKKDPHLVVWALSHIEIFSAIHRKHREGKIQELELHRVQKKLLALESFWFEVLNKFPMAFNEEG